MASNSDDSMTLDSRTPSRSSIQTPFTLCTKRTELTNGIQKLSLLIQGTNDTLNSLIRFGSYNPHDANVTMLQNLLLNYTSSHQQAVRNFAKINNPIALEEKIATFTEAVCSAHLGSSQPITDTRHTFTPSHIKELIAMKNPARKMHQNTLNPIYKTESSRLLAKIKKELKKHSQDTWEK
ncbi:hypothetical protein TNCV_5092341 [Trichonephila clavipes]|nr:hypothetical protein TNCV_5092341 [Trichonephila clavipes]